MTWRRQITLVAFSLAVAVSAGCADESVFLRIVQNNAPDDECAFAAGRGETFLSAGTLDVSGGTSYLMAPVVVNTAFADADDVASRRDVVLLGAEVSMKNVDVQGSFDIVEAMRAAEADARTQRFSGVVEAGGGETTVVFTAIDTEQGGLLQGMVASGQTIQIILEVKVFGEIGGGETESGVFQFPLNLCNGCLPAIDPEAENSRCFPFQI